MVVRMTSLAVLVGWLGLLCKQAQGLDQSQCIGPLGMETGAIEDSAISASSSFEDSTVGPHNARVRVDKNGGAWCPKNMIGKEGEEWLEIDLGSVHAISATESQGRFGNGQGVEFAESYMLEYYRPRLKRWARYRTREGKEVLGANSNTYSPVKNELNPVFLASKVRFHPYSNFKRTVCMRVEVYGCSWDDGVLTYSMPQGDRRGNAYEFYDWTYDGEWKGNSLHNGLGCLTDGDYGPEDYKLSYYAQGRGWVGWKQQPNRDMIEITFEFDRVREFHQVHLFTNNQFTRDIALFRELRVLFSVGGKIFKRDPLVYEPMEDAIFEEPRNVSVKLHRRVAKFVKLQLFFSAKWIMVSEVSFDSSVARGNYTTEVEEVELVPSSEGESGAVVNDVDSEVSQDTEGEEGSDPALMPIIIGVLTAVILLLAAIIFFIVNRSRQKKWLSVQMNDDEVMRQHCELGGEKMALHADYPFNYAAKGFTASSDTNSSGHSSQQPRMLLPKLDDNYNTPHHGGNTPRSLRYPSSNSGTPLGSRKTLPPVPRLQVPPPPPREEEAVYAEPGTTTAGAMYTEPYRAMKYSPYYGYGPVMSEIEDSLLKQALLSDTSCGDYAVPLPRQQQPPTMSSSSPAAIRKHQRKKHEQAPYKDSSSSSPCSTPQSDTLKAMRSRLENHVVPELSPSQLSLRQRLSEGSFGTVYVADAHGLPDYGKGAESGTSKRLVAVKFLAENATEQAKCDFVREVRLLSVLEDANISRVLGMCSTEDPHLVAMEYLEHGDLNQFLRCHLAEGTNPLPPGSRTLSFGTLVYMASQVASGMRYLEALNFVHRDLATRNCLVGRAYHLKICDFGSDNPLYARDYHEMETNRLLIPIRWMAWESVLLCKYTTKSDVWSFGVLLWEILQLASVRPYALLEDEDVIAQLEAIQKSEAQSMSGLERPSLCPRDLYELMCECWKREASSRPTFREIHLFLQRKNLGYSPI